MSEIRPVGSYACSVMDLIESRLKEYVQDHQRPPNLIHLTLSTSKMLAREIMGGLPPPPGLPEGSEPAIQGGHILNVPVFTCTGGGCKRADVFVGYGGDEELI